MIDRVITSRDNTLVKRARNVRDGRVREQIFIEGLRLCEEAAHSLDRENILDVISTERMAESKRGASLLSRLAQNGKRAVLVSEPVFSSISDTKTPQGIILLALRPNTDRSSLLIRSDKVPLLVVLHQLNNPSNVGAILRTAEAAGVSGVILTTGSTDIFSPKALRGAMGSTFRIPIWTDATLDEVLRFCVELGARTICTDLQAPRAHTEIDWNVPSALLVGSEASGFAREEIALADSSFKIPMNSPVESLNVAVAVGVVLYEAARQRSVGS